MADAKLRFAAQFQQLARHQRAGGGDDFHRQRNLPRRGFVFAFVGDADEFVRRAGDDFFAANNAPPPPLIICRQWLIFVGTVDIHRQADDVGQGNFRDFVLFQQRGGGFEPLTAPLICLPLGPGL